MGNGTTAPNPGDEIAVWLCRTESRSDGDLALMHGVLSEEEQARRDRFVFPEDRLAFTAAHALLRTALSRYDERPPRAWRFESTPSGKPFLAEPSPALSFNLTHTRTVVACVVTSGADVGIDVQECGQGADALSVAERYFATAERQLLAACPREHVGARFAELWVLKEAYMKGVGAGLSLPLDSFSFSFGDAASVTFDGAGASPWQFWLAALSPTTRLAVAAAGARPAARRRVSWWEHDGVPASRVTLLRSSAG
jgi:4'-phosphopantetheinyl transferase